MKMGVSKLSKDILFLVCKAHKHGEESISFEKVCESLKKNRDRYRKEGIKIALRDICQKGYLYREIGGNGYALKSMVGQITC